MRVSDRTSPVLDPPAPVPDPTPARRFLAVTEEELQRIVLDIHDGPVQQLFAAQAQVSLLQKLLARGDVPSVVDLSVELERLSEILRTVQFEIRALLGAFRAPDFAHRDLAEILGSLALQHEAFSGCEVIFDVLSAPQPVDLPLKIALYRICQEALSNAQRHSGARRLWITLRWAGDEVLLEVSDDGRGFTPPALQGPEATEESVHIGLRGMRERVEVLGGTLAVYSAPGAGTRVVVRVPGEV
jgi:signal transduction histidine kinase